MTFKTKEIHARAELCHGRHSLSYIASYWLGAAYSPNCCRSWQLGWACRLESTGWGEGEQKDSRFILHPGLSLIQGPPLSKVVFIPRLSFIQLQGHLQSRFVYNPKVIFNLGSSTIPRSSSIQVRLQSQGHLPSKVAIHSRSSSTQGCLSPIKVCLPQKNQSL